MADTLQEFETPDAATKAAQALESYQQKTDDLVGEALLEVDELGHNGNFDL